MPYTFKHGDRPLDGVTVQRAVGRGGFGEVYYAVTDSGKQVALKYLRENPEIELRGIAHVMNLKSPHLITIYDVKRNPAGEPFVIMEYVSGPSLRELMMAESGGMGVQKAAYFLAGIAKGLGYLHERGIVHRDLKPANIFYDDGYVKIGDYGLSKHMSVSKHSGQTVSVGTVHYMAPEIGSGSYTKAIDIYALGVILFEMLTGRLPYSGASMAEILMRHLRDNPDLSGVPAPFAPVISKALAKDPADRYQDADEMLAAVMDIADINRSLESFDVSSLSQVPRSPEAVDADTLTAGHGVVPPPPPPPLDVRDGAWAALREVDQLPERLQRRLDRLSQRLEQKAAKLERKFGRRKDAPPCAVPAGCTPTVNRRAQVFVLLAITVAVSIALAAPFSSRGGDPGQRIAAIAFMLAGSIVGPLLAHLRFLRNALTRNTVIDRLAYASVAGALMLPGYLMAEDMHRSMEVVIVAPLAALLICDWRKRIERGRQGHVDAWSAFWPGVCGLVATAICGSDRYVWLGAGLAAGSSLLVQATAALWPYAQRAATAPPLMGRRRESPPAPEPAPSPIAPAPVAAGTACPATPQDAAAPPAAAPVVYTAAQPSFIGRTANAGLAFIAKILMLAGLVLAVGQQPFLKVASEQIAEHKWHVGGPLQEVLATGQGVPPGVVLLPVVAGSLLLLVARRSDGVWHLVRGFVGCGLIVAGAAVGMAAGEAGLLALFTNQPLPNVPEARVWGPVIFMGACFGLAALLIVWPPARLQPRPIVI